MKQCILVTIFGISLPIDGATLTVALIVLQAVLAACEVCLLVWLLVRRSKTKKNDEPKPAEPAPEPAMPEPVTVPEPTMSESLLPVPTMPMPTMSAMPASPLQPVIYIAPQAAGQNQSFTASYFLADDATKEYYGTLKNEALSYRGAQSQVFWNQEDFYVDGGIAVRFFFRGETLCLCFPLDPRAYEGSEYEVESTALYADTPCMCRVDSSRRARCAAELIAACMRARGAERTPPGGDLT